MDGLSRSQNSRRKFGSVMMTESNLIMKRIATRIMWKCSSLICRERKRKRKRTSGGRRNITVGDVIPIGRTIRTTIEQICRFLGGNDLSCILKIGEEMFSRNTWFELPIGEIFKGIIYLVLKFLVRNSLIWPKAYTSRRKHYLPLERAEAKARRLKQGKGPARSTKPWVRKRRRDRTPPEHLDPDREGIFAEQEQRAVKKAMMDLEAPSRSVTGNIYCIHIIFHPH